MIDTLYRSYARALFEKTEEQYENAVRQNQQSEVSH